MKQTVSIVIPVYNEISRLFDGLRDIIAFTKKNTAYSYEIILVDDGSNPAAHTLLLSSSLYSEIERLVQKKKLRLLKLPRNIGKGGALKEGILRASGELIVFTDIDCSVPVSQIPFLLSALKKSDVAIGSRRLPGSLIVVHQPFTRETAGRIYTWLVNLLLGVSVRDVTCGFKAFTHAAAKELFNELSVRRWSFDAEIIYRARVKKLRLTEIPVTWSHKAGSRVKFQDSISSFLDLLAIKFRQENSAQGQQSERNCVCDQCAGREFSFLFDHHHAWKVQQCRSCGLTQVIPRPTRKEVAALYADDEDHFEPYVEQRLVHELYFQEKLDQVQTYTATARLRLLDIGCLTGVLLQVAKARGIEATGVDISKDAVRYCTRMGLDAFHGSVTDYARKYPRKKFDLITAFEIIEHEYSPKTLLQTIHEMLRPGGIVMLSTPNHGSWWRKVMGKYWPGYTHKEHLYFFDPDSLRNCLEQQGFNVLLLRTNDARPFPLSFLFTRGADYLPVGKGIAKAVGRLLEPIPIQNPVNPWDDLLIIARKQ